MNLPSISSKNTVVQEIRKISLVNIFQKGMQGRKESHKFLRFSGHFLNQSKCVCVK